MACLVYLPDLQQIVQNMCAVGVYVYGSLLSIYALIPGIISTSTGGGANLHFNFTSKIKLGVDGSSRNGGLFLFFCFCFFLGGGRRANNNNHLTRE